MLTNRFRFRRISRSFCRCFCQRERLRVEKTCANENKTETAASAAVQDSNSTRKVAIGSKDDFQVGRNLSSVEQIDTRLIDPSLEARSSVQFDPINPSNIGSSKFLHGTPNIMLSHPQTQEGSASDNDNATSVKSPELRRKKPKA